MRLKELKKLVNENFVVGVEIKEEEALDSGASLLVYSTDECSIIGIDALFDKKTQSFDIDLDGFLEDLAVDENLADMIIVPASLAKGKPHFKLKKLQSIWKQICL